MDLVKPSDCNEARLDIDLSLQRLRFEIISESCGEDSGTVFIFKFELELTTIGSLFETLFVGD
jgi:hypothetical protein